MQPFCDNIVTRAAILVLLLAATGLASFPPRFDSTIQQNSAITAAEQNFAEGQRLLTEATAPSQRQAIERFTEAARLWHAVGDQRKEAIALSFAGKVYDLLGEKLKALDLYTQTLSLVRAVSDRASEAATLNNIGLIYDSLGEKQKALDYYNHALPVLESIGNTRIQAITLVNIGLVHDSMGEKQKALQLYQQALPLLRSARDQAAEAVTLNNIGYLYDSIGEQQKALTYFSQALPILQQIGDHRVEAITLNNIGYVYDALDEKQKALEYYNRALPVLQTVGDRRMQAITLNNIGLVQKGLGDTQRALGFLNQALELRRAVNDRSGEGITLSDLGSVYALLGEEQKALDFYQQSLRLSRAAEDKGTESSTLRRIAFININRGQLEEARRNLETALNIVEHLRVRIAGQELRASYFASVQQFFDSYIDLMMRLHRVSPDKGYDALALQAAERARARSLLDSLRETGANIREGVATALLDRENALRQKLDAVAERQARLVSGNHSDEEAATLKNETERLLTEYQEVETEIRASSPRYAALTQPLPLSLKEIQQQVVDADTVLLEYALGDDKSYLWVVTTSSIHSYELPPRKAIETATRNVYQLLTERNRDIRFEKLVERRARIAKADTDYAPASTALSRMLLGPAASLLEKKRLLIVGDGALNYLPFALLPEPTGKSSVPLIFAHEIVGLPSASTLAVLRQEFTNRLPAPKTLAVIADPVFEKDDARVKAMKVGGRNDHPNDRAIEDRMLVGLANVDLNVPKPQSESDEVREIHRLPFTRQEADEILALVPEADRLKALDFDANRVMVTSATLGQYRYVHFATHGFLNAVHPELSGIVLSLVNQQGAEQDGFLWANDVYNLRLPAEMVVLSGCRTGLGKQIKGEGVVGLTRGFMYAGSKRVLVSLWDISDEASAELMARLYKAMLKENRSPAAALRTAQIEIMKDKRWQAPYYWAAFVLQGEPR
ncbi:MAG TPA: CHAT domain-containing protein [Pyrinomonadaceae bacterium]|nr:CHAT domain-containing protein [Pyrinomonadaceae bacterium]